MSKFTQFSEDRDTYFTIKQALTGQEPSVSSLSVIFCDLGNIFEVSFLCLGWHCYPYLGRLRNNWATLSSSSNISVTSICDVIPKVIECFHLSGPRGSTGFLGWMIKCILAEECEEWWLDRLVHLHQRAYDFRQGNVWFIQPDIEWFFPVCSGQSSEDFHPA